MEDKIKKYLLLGKLLKNNGASTEVIGKLFVKLLDDVDYSYFGIGSKGIQFCEVESEKDPSLPYQVIDLKVCQNKDTDDETFNSIINQLLEK
jgi:hypothetical protein